MVNVLIKKDAHLYNRYHECSQCESILEFMDSDLTERLVPRIKYDILLYEINCPNCQHDNKVDVKKLWKMRK